MTQVDTNLETLLAKFQKHLVSQDRSRHSIRAYVSDARLFAIWFEQNAKEPFTPSAISFHDVREWRDQAAESQKPATINRKLAALSAFFTWAIDEGIIYTDPTLKVQGVEQQITAPKAIPDDDLKRIMRRVWNSENRRDCALLEFLAATGLRVSEVAALKHGDLQLGDRSGWVIVKMGKGKKQRKVPVNVRAREALHDYLEHERKGIKAEDPLFTAERGGAMSVYAIWYTVKKYAAQAGLNNISTHSFRHTVATRLVRNPKVDIVTASTFLGHSRIETTARYARPSDEDLANAAEQI